MAKKKPDIMLVWQAGEKQKSNRVVLLNASRRRLEIAVQLFRHLVVQCSDATATSSKFEF